MGRHDCDTKNQGTEMLPRYHDLSSASARFRPGICHCPEESARGRQWAAISFLCRPILASAIGLIVGALLGSSSEPVGSEKDMSNFKIKSTGAIKHSAPITTDFKILNTPRLGLICNVTWSGLPRITPSSSELLIRIDAPSTQTLKQSPIVLIKDQETTHVCPIRIDEPGQYNLFACVTMYVGGGQFAKEDALSFEVLR